MSRSKVRSIRVNTRPAIEEVLGNFLRVDHNDVLFQHTDREDITYYYKVSTGIHEESQQTVNSRPFCVGCPRLLGVNTENIPDEGQRKRTRWETITTDGPSSPLE